ncbi:hypothetical protein FN846DRAFT_749233 [Sphaerosporella brunnea]|uniref:Uncharacterized protein n=1 Tax=Sphaerosporella brunnea TaxID=1250544 RepID=A0A5J5EWA7_9PEZI|nr:hypothetical protein FN846DRAFT_749233 [Sphaerosporella brunnea]
MLTDAPRTYIRLPAASVTPTAASCKQPPVSSFYNCWEVAFSNLIHKDSPPSHHRSQRGNVLYLFQTFYLLNGSVRSLLLRGLFHACRARDPEWISELQQGLETRVGKHSALLVRLVGVGRSCSFASRIYVNLLTRRFAPTTQNVLYPAHLPPTTTVNPPPPQPWLYPATTPFSSDRCELTFSHSLER